MLEHLELSYCHPLNPPKTLEVIPMADHGYCVIEKNEYGNVTVVWEKRTIEQVIAQLSGILLK